MKVNFFIYLLFKNFCLSQPVDLFLAMNEITYKEPKNHEDWLEIRNKSIGGSDAAALVYLNSFSTPYSVWMDKTGRSEPKEMNIAMEVGHELEPYVANRFTRETGIEVEIEPRVIYNSAYPYSHATIDRKVVGENAGLECKTTNSLNLKKYKDGEFPENYYIQCLHYMAVGGFDKYYLAVLVGNNQFFHFEINRTEEVEEMITELMEQEKEFWESYVIPDIAPPVDGLKPTEDAISLQYAESNGETVSLIDFDETLDQLFKLKKTIRELQDRESLLKQQVEVELGFNEVGETENYIIEYKPRKRTTLQTKELKKANPQIDYSCFEKTSQFRVMKIKEKQ